MGPPESLPQFHPQPTLLGIPAGKEKRAISPLESAKGEGGERGPLPTLLFTTPAREREKEGEERGGLLLLARRPFLGVPVIKVFHIVYTYVRRRRLTGANIFGRFSGKSNTCWERDRVVVQTTFFSLLSHQQKAEERRDRLRSFPPLFWRPS